MNNFLISALIAWFMVHPFALAGESVIKEPQTRYIVTKFITEETVRDLSLALQNNPKLSEIEFRDSFGAWGNKIAITKTMIDLIEKNQLKTYAKGYCAFACATIFLMGKDPTLLTTSSGKATRLILRPLMSADEEFLKEETDEFFNKIVERSKGKIPVEFFSWLYQVKDEIGALYIWSEQKLPAKYIQFHADSKSAFENISDLTPLDLGIRVVNPE